jgi:WD40 repeat protein
MLDGRPICVTGSRDSSVKVWNIETGQLLHDLRGHAAAVRCLEVAGNQVVSGSYDTTCRVSRIFLLTTRLTFSCGTRIRENACMCSLDTFNRFTPSPLMGYGLSQEVLIPPPEFGQLVQGKSRLARNMFYPAYFQ